MTGTPFKRPRGGRRRASIGAIKGGRAAAAVTAGARRGRGGSRCRHGLQREEAGVGRGGLLLPRHAGEAGRAAARRHGNGALLRRGKLGPGRGSPAPAGPSPGSAFPQPGARRPRLQQNQGGFSQPGGGRRMSLELAGVCFAEPRPQERPPLGSGGSGRC